jgi:trans-aconitate 2-methyltransferase
MPDNLDEPTHVLMREVAQLAPWREQLAEAARVRDNLPKPGGYYDALGPRCTRLEIWHTIYNHVLEDAAAIVEWVKGTGLRPFVDPLPNTPRAWPPAICHKRTARCCCGFRGFSSWL